MNIAVYCGSQYGNNSHFAETAEKLGREIAKRGHTLVYGGSRDGIMGIIADAALAEGGRVIGVIPDIDSIRESRHENLSEYYYTESMSTRKQKMTDISDAFIALPGGPGTLDEISDILALERVGSVNAPVVLVNTDGYYDSLRTFFDTMRKCSFTRPDDFRNVLFSDDIAEIMGFIEK